MKGKYRVYLQIMLTVDGESFEDVEFKVLNAYANSKPKLPTLYVENMSVDGMDAP